VATRDSGEVVEVIGRAGRLPEGVVRLLASAMRVVGPPGGIVESPTSAMGVVRLPTLVTGVPALRRVLMGEGTRSISNKNS
jgi:hypothetical protein